MPNDLKQEEKIKLILKELKKLFPEAFIELNYSNSFELLVATILSAQCTDKLVNKVTDNLFKKYTSLDAYANANLEEFSNDIHSVNFYKNKAKNIIASAKKIREDYNGMVPETMEELLNLPGIARKSANVLMGVAFNKPVGIVVDTHVKRLANLFGLTSASDPVKIEQDLMLIVPRSDWREFGMRLTLYGRRYCPARPHAHINCPVSKALAGI